LTDKLKEGSSVAVRALLAVMYNNSYSIKKHWNTINCQGNLPDEEIKKLVDLSYELVLKSLPKRERENLQYNSI